VTKHVRELKVALIGAGFMGKAHSLAYGVARIADDLGGSLVKEVIVDADGPLAKSFAEQFGWNASGTDWREAIERPDIDIIDICTPPQFHEEIALAAIAAGKNVFCEKPITNDADQAIRMGEIAREASVNTQVGFDYRHTPAIGFAKQLLAEGKLGVPLQVRGSYLQDAGFAADPNRWRASKKTGGSGAVGDIGSHVIDVAEYLCGDVVRVASRIRSKSPDAAVGWFAEGRRIADDLVDDAGVWIAEFAKGVIGSFAVTSFSSGRKNRIALELDGTLGAFDFDWNDREVFRVSYVDEPADHQGFRNIHTNTQHPDSWWRLAGLGTGYLDVSAVQFQKFIRSIVSGTPATPDFSHCAHIQQVVEAIHQAAIGDGWVDVPANRTGSQA